MWFPDKKGGQPDLEYYRALTERITLVIFNEFFRPRYFNTLIPAPYTCLSKMTKPNLDFKGGFVQIINGQSAPTSKTRHGVNPATLQPHPEVPVATRDDLDRAVAAATEAFIKWQKTPYEERRSLVLKYANAMVELRTEFRDLLIAEQGKPVSTNHYHSLSVQMLINAYIFMLVASSRLRDRLGNWLDARNGRY